MHCAVCVNYLVSVFIHISESDNFTRCVLCRMGYYKGTQFTIREQKIAIVP